MSALALYLKESGFEVSGSDKSKGEIVAELKRAGITVYSRHDKLNVQGCDAFVYNSAISEDNPELIYAQNCGIPIIERSKLLSYIMSCHKKSIGVAGCHGKTTTTAMIAHVFKVANLSPTAFIGAKDGFMMGQKDYCIAEACEYKKNFLNLNPNVAVILNIGFDHADSYKDINDVANAFSIFTKDKIAVINEDDIFSEKLFGKSTITFGIDKMATYRAKYLTLGKQGYSFTLYIYGKKTCRINLKIGGRHNVYNALATCSVCHSFGMDIKTIKRGLETFNGVSRRCERMGNFNGVPVIADYAHHPTEVSALIKGFIERKKRPLVIFQPHTYSRTQSLMGEFINALSLKEENGATIIYKTYSAREKFNYSGSGYSLYKSLCKNLKETGDPAQKVYYVNTPKKLFDNISYLLKSAKINCDCILVVGAGDIYDIFKKRLKSTKSLH